MSSNVRLLPALMIVVFFCGSPLTAQERATATKRGTQQPGARAPFRLDPDPPPLTNEQLRDREEEVNEAHPGPPLPVLPGAEVAPPSVPPTPPRADTATLMRLRSNEIKPAAPGTMTYFRATAHGPYATGTSTVAETHTGAAGPVVFMTGNWFASFSTNNGSSFSFVNPYNTFGSLDGGFCCDQTVIYDRTRDQMIWQLQYSYSSTTGKNSYVTAFAPAASVQTSGWCWYDWSPSDFGLGSGLWLDYPNVALSNNYVWYTANVYNAADVWQRTIIWRVPLSSAASCSSVTFDYLVVSDRFNFSVTQGATTTMYWASHNNTSSMRVYRWAENSSTIYWDDVSITTWPRTLPYSCPGPDGLNWCGRGPNDGRIQTGWVANGVIGFMWNASAGGGYPRPHVRVVRLNESNRALLNEPVLWHSDFAWQFPAIGVNDRGHIAGSAYWGGGTAYPTMNVLIADDFSSGPPPWENHYVVASAKGAGNWGDWYSTRRHGASGNTWVTSGQALLANNSVQSWYVWFGRERDNPIVTAPTVSTPTVTGVTTSLAILGGTVNSDGGGSITERGVVYSATATNANPLIGGTGVTKATTSGTTGTFTVSVSSLAPGTSYSYKAFATNSGGTGYSSAGTFSTSTFSGPASLNAAAASPTQVGLLWPVVANASHYEIARSTGGAYSTIGTSGVGSYTDNGVSGNLTYLYKVRAIDASANASPYSPVDPATTVMFTDEPVMAASTTVKSVHIAQLRTAVNAMRGAAGLSAVSFVDPILTTVKAQHIVELRAALDAARTALLLSAVSYTDPSLAAGTAVKAAHVQQLRTGVR